MPRSGIHVLSLKHFYYAPASKWAHLALSVLCAGRRDVRKQSKDILSARDSSAHHLQEARAQFFTFGVQEIHMATIISAFLLGHQTALGTKVGVSPLDWPNRPPENIPFPRSTLFDTIEFTGRYAQYGKADTWYPTWAADGKLYSPWTDGSVGDAHAGSSCNGAWCLSTTGFASISGHDPFNLTIERVGTVKASPWPYHGRYPCGSLAYNGTWFYGTYALDDLNGYCQNWCIQGPFLGFRWSTDGGETWTEPRPYLRNGYRDSLFGEGASDNHSSKIKYGAPHVVDFGRELEHAPAEDPETFMYIVGHGASQPASPTSWMQGSEVYLARVRPTIEDVQNASQWQFFAGRAVDGNDLWAKGRVADAKPVVSWANKTGVTTMTYVPAVQRYIMIVSTPTLSPFTEKTFDTYLLESKHITGPFHYITYMKEFGPQAYFVNIPSKFVDSETKDGSLRLFLSSSANFAAGNVTANPPGSGYHWTLHEVVLKPPAAPGGVYV
eukprot:TRINITY_DN62068_c0_g1_i1.p1 TRINITY_DN62068_c0_g1~~TRINITY_DN62068_c0_g1_i1.p1  ORF type:complete len:496 (-),score=18.09 TRINITY_DN62068_c0_g1_i1:40-1527(-)